MAALFGIHFGNCSACIAFCKDEERVAVIANDTGDRITPTMVQWSPSQSLVGRSAVLEQFRHLQSTVSRTKQLLNDDISDEELDELRKQVPFKIHKSGNAVKYEIVIDGKQNQVSTKDIALSIFKKLYSIATTSVTSGTELQAVIAVPPYFSAKSIQTIREIASKAGFTVLQIVDEPSVAVLASMPSEKSGNCLVCRVGGVSLDVTILDIRDGMFSILSTAHKFDSAGRYITEKLRELLSVEFSRQYKGQEITERGKFKLESAAETAKQILSIQNSAQCSAESIGGGYDLNCSVSRPRLDNIVSAILPNISEAICEALKTANLSSDQIDSLILCGGTSKIPRVQDFIKGLLPRAEMLVGSANPEETIAIGAATQARYSTKIHVDLPTCLAFDVFTTSAKISIKVSDKNSKECDIDEVAAGTVLPISRTISIPENSSCIDLNVDSATVQTLPLNDDNDSLKLQIDREGLLKLDLSKLVQVSS